MTEQRRKMRIGLAGLGAASVQILQALSEHPGYDVASGADPRADARAAFEREFGTKAVDSVEELCDDPSLDAIYIATPNYLHCEHVLIAIAHGKDVIVEKPMALSLDECDQMIAAAEANNVRLLAGHTHSFDAPIAAMRREVARGSIGEVYMINQWYYTDWLFRGRMSEELQEDKGGGVVFRQGPHGVDIARILGGGVVTSVLGRTSALDPRHPTDGSYVAMLNFDNGIVATLVFSGYAHFDTSELTYGIGENGCPRPIDTHLERRQQILGYGDMQTEELYKNARRYGGDLVEAYNNLAGHGCPEEVRRHPFYGLTIVSGSEGDLRQTPTGLKRYGSTSWADIEVPRGALEREAELSVLCDAWLRDEPIHAHDGRWGKATLEVCLAIRESSRSGRLISCQYQVPFKD